MLTGWLSSVLQMNSDGICKFNSIRLTQLILND